MIVTAQRMFLFLCKKKLGYQKVADEELASLLVRVNTTQELGLEKVLHREVDGSRREVPGC